MAPNLTLPNMGFLVETPVDLTLSPNSKWNNKSSSHMAVEEMRILSRRMPISQPSVNENLKEKDAICVLPEVQKKELCRSRSEEPQNQEVQTGGNIIDTPSEKCKYAIARKWLKDNVQQTRRAVLSIYSLVAAYSLFCKENGERPVNESAFFDIIKSEFSGQYFKNIGSVSLQNNLFSLKSTNVSQNQKRKHATNAEDELKIAGIYDKRVKNLRVDLEKQETRKQLAISKDLFEKIDDISDNEGNTVESPGKQAEEQEVQHTLSLKEIQAFEDYKDSDSSDSGCEYLETKEIRGKLRRSYHDNLVIKQKKVHKEANPSSPWKLALREKTFLELDNESCDSGLESNDSDSESLRRSTKDIHLNVSSDEKELSYLDEASSSVDEEELGSLIIDVSDGGISPIHLDNLIPNSVKIKEELPLNVDVIEGGNLSDDFNHRASKSKAFEESRTKIISNVAILLNLKEFSESKCILDARKFSAIFVQMMQNNLLSLFLQILGHSMSCKAVQCSKLCFMFKRILKHLISASTHNCAVKHIYGHILRLHIDTCKEANCGISNCKLLRSKRMENRATLCTSRG